MNLMRGITILVGCVIGAGILGVPYAVYQAGFLTGILVLLILGIAVLMINLFLGEITLRTKGTHQLPGYAEIYLGKKAKKIMLFAMALGIYGALTAYLIGEGEVLSALLGVTSQTGTLIFFLVGGALIYTGLKAVDKAEGWLVLFLVIITLLVFSVSLTEIQPGEFSEFSIEKIFIPYGVILFALNGLVAIPEMKEELIENKHLLKKAIIVGTMIPVVLYTLFIVAVMGTSGGEFPSGSTMANEVIRESVGGLAAIAFDIFTFLAMASSFLVLGLALNWLFTYDIGLDKRISWLAALLPPLIIALLDITTFVSILSFVGSFCVGIQAIMVVLMHRKAKEKSQRTPEYAIRDIPAINYLLIILLFSGVIIGTFFV